MTVRTVWPPAEAAAASASAESRQAPKAVCLIPKTVQVTLRGRLPAV
jgi:hypothetical protein